MRRNADAAGVVILPAVRHRKTARDHLALKGRNLKGRKIHHSRHPRLWPRLAIIPTALS